MLPFCFWFSPTLTGNERTSVVVVGDDTIGGVNIHRSELDSVVVLVTLQHVLQGLLWAHTCCLTPQKNVHASMHGHKLLRKQVVMLEQPPTPRHELSYLHMMYTLASFTPPFYRACFTSYFFLFYRVRPCSLALVQSRIDTINT
ncbi:unnamed protein product [Ectocarpus sp. 13 AM-2016]